MRFHILGLPHTVSSTDNLEGMDLGRECQSNEVVNSLLTSAAGPTEAVDQTQVIDPTDESTHQSQSSHSSKHTIASL